MATTQEQANQEAAKAEQILALFNSNRQQLHLDYQAAQTELADLRQANPAVDFTRLDNALSAMGVRVGSLVSDVETPDAPPAVGPLPGTETPAGS